MVSENDVGIGEVRSGSSQWSLKCLGGKPLRCDGLRLVFYPVHSAAASEGNNTYIELTIEKKRPKTSANIKRTPFEEENYIASAWMRPLRLPMSRGPRCLRVLPPTADMAISNLTESFTNGKVAEGTVNRIVLKLKAGSQENCNDIKIRFSCSSLMISPEGQTILIKGEGEENPEGKRIADKKNPSVRTPILVQKDEGASALSTEFGYNLPSGWKVLPSCQGDEDGYLHVTSKLQKGDATYVCFDLYRPSPQVTETQSSTGQSFDDEDLAYEENVCQSDIEVSVCYRQERPARKTKQMPVRRKPRKKPGEQAGSVATATAEEDESDLVYLSHNVQVMWSAPISAIFSPGRKQYQPSGNRHPSNFDAGPSTISGELVLVDRERISSKCTLEAAASVDGLLIDIEEVRFEVRSRG